MRAYLQLCSWYHDITLPIAKLSISTTECSLAQCGPAHIPSWGDCNAALSLVCNSAPGLRGWGHQHQGIPLQRQQKRNQIYSRKWRNNFQISPVASQNWVGIIRFQMWNDESVIFKIFSGVVSQFMLILTDIRVSSHSLTSGQWMEELIVDIK